MIFGNLVKYLRLETKTNVIPIPKPGKDETDSSSFRSIILTSGLCKTLQRMINNISVWY